MRKTIYICDRCKREVRPNELKAFGLDKTTNIFGKISSYLFSYDLCKDCVKELTLFLKQEGT